MTPLQIALVQVSFAKVVPIAGTAVNGLSRLDALLPAGHALGERHAGYGVEPEDCAPVGAALLGTLSRAWGTSSRPRSRRLGLMRTRFCRVP